MSGATDRPLAVLAGLEEPRQDVVLVGRHDQLVDRGPAPGPPPTLRITDQRHGPWVGLGAPSLDGARMARTDCGGGVRGETRWLGRGRMGGVSQGGRGPGREAHALGEVPGEDVAEVPGRNTEADGTAGLVPDVLDPGDAGMGGGRGGMGWWGSGGDTGPDPTINPLMEMHGGTLGNIT